MITEVLFWLAALTPIYAYIGYPLVLIGLSKVIHRRVKKSSPYTPSVSLLIPAYREAGVIREKIRNVLALDYPEDGLEIVVACDGSPDETPQFASQEVERLGAGKRIQVVSYPVNRGKVTALNDTVPKLRGEIVVFSDASSMLYPDSLRKLVENFSDPEVGAVSGKYILVKADQVTIGKSEDFYWKYETYLKVLESRISSTLGAHGHLNGIRKQLYPFPAAGTINDDYVIATSVLARGYRTVYEPEAIGYEEAQDMAGFGRRIRIMAGNIQQLAYLPGLLDPFCPMPLFFFISHKVVRLLVPFAMVLLIAINLLLLDRPVYQLLGVAQAGFYLLALAGTFWKLRPKLLALPYYFTMINAAMFGAVYHSVAGLHRMRWK